MQQVIEELSLKKVVICGFRGEPNKKEFLALKQHRSRGTNEKTKINIYHEVLKDRSKE